MSDHSTRNDSEPAELQWARAHVRPWLLGRLSEPDEDRFDEAVSLSPDFPYELDEAEEAMISAYIEGSLAISEREAFVRIYVSGPEYKRTRLRVQQALQAERGREPMPMPAAEPRAIPLLRILFGRSLAPALVAALVLIGLFAFYWQWQNRSHTRQEIAKQPAQEQPAGDTQENALVLDGSSATGSPAVVKAAPVSIVWTVPDYSVRYRIRVSFATGAELTSPPLEPKDNAVSFPMGSAPAVPLPWNVFLLNAQDGSVRSQRKVTRQQP
jgi:hypothetical protein